MNTTPTRQRVADAQKQIESASKKCAKALEFLQESRAIIADRAAREKEILRSFKPNDTAAISDLAHARTSQELHTAGIERILELDAPEALQAAQEALGDIASALMEAVDKQREELLTRLRRAMDEFGGQKEVSLPAGGTITAGELAASAAAAELPSFAALPRSHNWPMTVWDRHPHTFDRAVSGLSDTLNALATMQGIAADFLKNGSFLGGKRDRAAA